MMGWLDQSGVCFYIHVSDIGTHLTSMIEVRFVASSLV